MTTTKELQEIVDAMDFGGVEHPAVGTDVINGNQFFMLAPKSHLGRGYNKLKCVPFTVPMGEPMPTDFLQGVLYAVRGEYVAMMAPPGVFVGDLEVVHGSVSA